jgi:hypothetical protein
MARSRYGARRGSRYGPSPNAGGGALLYGALIALLVAGVGFGAWAVRDMTKDDTIDSATLCPATGATGLLALLFDLTDPISTTQSLALRAFVEDRIATSPRGTLIAVGIVSDDPSALGARIAICKPMTGAEAGDLIRNSAQVERRYREAFLAPLQAELAAMLETPAASQSPIMEGLQALVAAVARFDVNPEGRRELVLVSDLAQHSEAMSFYRGDDWERFRESAAFGRLARSLEGVEVTVLRVARAIPQIDAGAVDDFWVRYFDAQGASRIDPRPLGDL